jgi:hypothetical protein
MESVDISCATSVERETTASSSTRKTTFKPITKLNFAKTIVKGDSANTKINAPTLMESGNCRDKTEAEMEGIHAVLPLILDPLYS